MPAHTLTAGALEVDIQAPGFYTGPRFDWTSQVTQVRLEGRPFLTREKEDGTGDQGWGLACEFGIETPVGYEDCAPGEFFPKIGVGLLKKPDGKPYHFAGAYPLRPALFTVSPEPGALTFTAEQTPERGYGWVLTRRWSVAPRTLTLETTLRNTGSRLLATEEYCHNFLAAVPGWTLTTPRPWDRGALTSVVDPESVLDFSGGLSLGGTAARDFFFSDQRPGTPGSWTLTHRAGSVTETLDQAPFKINVWGKGHVVSPELYLRIDVPEGSRRWTRMWRFG